MMMMFRQACTVLSQEEEEEDDDDDDDDDVYYYMRWRLKLEGETENKGVREKVGFTEKTAKRHRRGG